jgi:hypothetical protein
MNYYIKVGLDSIDGADTTVVINIKGRMFDDEAWALIETVTTAEIGAEVNTVVESMTDADYTYLLGTGQAASTQFAIKQDTTGLMNYPADSLVVPDITFAQSTRAFTVTPSIKPCYRQVQVELIYNGPDYTGAGVALKDIRWYFQKSNQ